MHETIHILFEKSGLLTTVQDAGRPGFQSYGVPVGGAMDRYSARMANALVSNPKDGPVLEISIQGPQIYFLADAQIAICGADLSPVLDDIPIPNWETIKVKGGQRLRFGTRKSGCRAYLAIAGSWKLPSWLGSAGRATLFPDKLTPDSTIHKGSSLSIEYHKPVVEKALPATKRPSFSAKPILEVTPGPEFDQLGRYAIARFFGQTYTVQSSSNRMGYVLDPPLAHYTPDIRLISSGIIPGTIQIMREGRPIVLMADAQTVGGYPRIAVLVRQSMDRLAQCPPGEQVRFQLKS